MKTATFTQSLADALVTCVGANARDYARRVRQDEWTSANVELGITISHIAKNTAEPMLFALGCPADQRELIISAAQTYAYYAARSEVFPGETAVRIRIRARDEFYDVLDQFASDVLDRADAAN
jgi:hypothetical protein